MRAGALCWVLVLLAPHLSEAPKPPPANSSEPFVATDDWQSIQPGQAIPKGLHVRINLETGVKEAKLLDPKENDKKSLSVVPENDAIPSNDTASNKTVHDNATEIPVGIEEALKNIANTKIDSKGKIFKSLDEIRSEFKDMNMEIKSDMEIMQDLFYRYRRLTRIPPYVKPLQKNKLDPDPVDTKNAIDMLDILIDLEYLTHQIDNANEFVRLKGFETIIYPLLNGTDNTLKSEALKIMSASLQNNINVQVYALETNASEMLLKILSLDNSEHIKGRAIRALSCLVRGFPAAQKQITSKHGLDVFQKILMSSNSNYFNLKVAILVLLDDLSLEHKLVADYHTTKPEDLEKAKLYREVNLAGKLSNPVFCDVLSKFLQEYFEYNLTDLDYVHKIIPSMTTFAHICKNYHYKDKKLLATFHKMQTVYKKNMLKKNIANDTESSNEIVEFYTSVLEFIENYLDILNNSKFDDEL